MPKKHDTKGLIKRTAASFYRVYMDGGRSYFPASEEKDVIASRLWLVRDYADTINRAMDQKDYAWFIRQRSNYKSTLRWKIFIEAVNLIVEGGE